MPSHPSDLRSASGARKFSTRARGAAASGTRPNDAFDRARILFTILRSRISVYSAVRVCTKRRASLALRRARPDEAFLLRNGSPLLAAKEKGKGRSLSFHENSLSLGVRSGAPGATILDRCRNDSADSAHFTAFRERGIFLSLPPVSFPSSGSHAIREIKFPRVHTNGLAYAYSCLLARFPFVAAAAAAANRCSK